MQAIGTVATAEHFFGDDQADYCLQALAQSMIVHELEVDQLVARPHRDYDDLVLEGKALHQSDIARFYCPEEEHPSMLWGRPEYFRWYTTDGKKREAPLDFDELVKLVQYRERCSLDDAEREVALNSRAQRGDKQMYQLAKQLGYLEWAREFALDEGCVF